MNRYKRISSSPLRVERGSVLVVSLLIMLVMTLLGITAMSTTTLEERMAGNARDKNIAFQAAEAGLRDGEADVLKNSIADASFVAACTNGLCLPSTTVTPVWSTVNWSGDTTRIYGAYTAATALTGVSKPPRYVIELIRDIPDSESSITSGIKPPTTGTAYRITAQGYGATATTTVQLQAVVVRI